MMKYTSVKLIGILLLLLCFCIAYSCVQEQGETAGTYTGDFQADHKFVGDQTCQSCHAQEWEDWKGSHHDYAIAGASEESVRGDFENSEFSPGNNQYRFFRDEGQFKVEVTEQGDARIHEISYTFGWEPLQQYLIDIGQGKMQALHIAWDTERNRWFSLQPEEEPEPGDWMHWTGGAMNWNTMCADCHSTNLKENFIAESDSFHTEWSVLNVSCEACHGPGGEHVDFMNSPESEEASPERIRSNLDLGRFTSQLDEINTCAPCHSLRQKLTDDYMHGDNYLDHFDPQLPHPDNYFADGQIHGEVYVYASFLQSRMFAEGVQCTDCHNPHTLELKEPLTNNKLCMQCHEPQYNTPDHHFHEINTEASQCVNCHMTGRTYMEVDYRRDHSFRVPRPHQSEQFGTPNACNDCHTEQSADWAAHAIEDWYGEDRSPHFTDVLVRAADDSGTDIQKIRMQLGDLIADTSQPEIIRATAVWYAGRYPDMNSTDLIREALGSESAMIRSSAAKAADNLPAEMRTLALREALDDSVKGVRMSAIQNLAGFSTDDFGDAYKDHFQNALQEYKAYLEVNRYFPQGEMNRGLFYEQQGETDKAIDAYQNTLKRDSRFNPARINLAYLYNSQGQNAQAERLLKEVIDQEPDFGQAYYSLALLLAEENRLEEAVSYFERASELLPEQSRILYNLAVANQTLGKSEEAEIAYKQAIETEPGNGDYVYGLITLFMQQENYKAALEQALILNEIHPDNPQVQQLIRRIEQQI
ncbi:MAG: tetratricopeptide repeat protein [Balneolaceae bacterium]